MSDLISEFSLFNARAFIFSGFFLALGLSILKKLSEPEDLPELSLQKIQPTSDVFSQWCTIVFFFGSWKYSETILHSKLLMTSLWPHPSPDVPRTLNVSLYWDILTISLMLLNTYYFWLMSRSYIPKISYLNMVSSSSLFSLYLMRYSHNLHWDSPIPTPVQSAVTVILTGLKKTLDSAFSMNYGSSLLLKIVSSWNWILEKVWGS